MSGSARRTGWVSAWGEESAGKKRTSATGRRTSSTGCDWWLDGIIGRVKMGVSPERWWEYAERDLETARVLLRAKRWDATSLFAQQAVEKAFKAMLVRKGEESPPRIHDLVVLAPRAGAPATLERDLTELSWVYVVTLYPDVVLEREPAYGIDQAMAEHHLQVANGALA
jgi:HEPN domain-containing protein